MRSRTTRGLALAIAAVTLYAGRVGAQRTDDAAALRRGWGAHAGLVVYGTGAEVNCPTGAGFSVGGEVRTRGRWLLAAGADAILAASMVCTSVGVTTTFEGEPVDVASGTQLIGAPRFRVRAGRTFTLGRWTIEPAVGTGLIFGRTDFVGGTEWLWNRWSGASLALRNTALPVGLEVEYGGHQVPIRYQRQDRSRTVVREFRLWKPMLRLSVVL